MTAREDRRDDDGGLARINRISAQQGFGEDDPRAGPFDEAQIAEARSYLNARDRWHAVKGVDLFAVRLQYGRGIRRVRAAQMFDIGDNAIRSRKALAGKARWISNMSERDRRGLARLVWLGGLLRRLDAGGEADDAMLATLRNISEWRRFEDDVRPVWLPQDENGEALPMTAYTEISDDAHDAERSADHDEHADLWARLEAELDAIEAETSDEEETDGGRTAPAEGDQGSGEVSAHADLHGSEAGPEAGGILEAVGA